jgi:LDH2 family malate/lactate/ureidoglycolate dehydrogenase
VTDARRYRIDDLRRFASALAAGVGVAPTRALALASHLLWFDAAGAAPLGIATLADGLDQIESRSIDPKAEGSVVAERGSTALFDGRRGVPLLVLDRAAALAAEKARETGVGLVRVRNVSAPGSAAGVAADLALGPMAAIVLGPGPSWAVALPAEGGLPAVFDVALAAAPGAGSKPNRPKAAAEARAALDGLVAPWAAVLAPDGGWLVAAVAVTAMEPLSAFHERVADALDGLDESAGRLLPAAWEARRREAREHGVSVEPAAWRALVRWADRLGVEPPAPHTPRPARMEPR